MDDQQERLEAIERLESRRDLRAHVVLFGIVNVGLVVIWAATGAGYFWPIWPIAGWGIALAMNVWAVFGRSPITDDDIRREMQRHPQ